MALNGECDMCGKDERLTYDKIKSRRGQYCEDCIDGYAEYVDREIAERKEDEL